VALDSIGNIVDAAVDAANVRQQNLLNGVVTVEALGSTNDEVMPMLFQTGPKARAMQKQSFSNAYT
jgi:hypothetical protein